MSGPPRRLTVGPPPATIPHELLLDQERSRRWLMIWLVIVFGTEVIFVLLAMTVPAMWCKTVPVDEIKEVMLIIFGPTIALVGSATGFYFSTRHHQ
jgi:hypothetical protein